MKLVALKFCTDGEKGIFPLNVQKRVTVSLGAFFHPESDG